MNMDGVSTQTEARRRFLRMLVATPLFSGSLFGGSLRNLLPILEVLQQTAEVISSPDQALDVMDFEPAARKALPPAHFGYLATGVDDDGTVRANREGYSRLQIRSNRVIRQQGEIDRDDSRLFLVSGAR